jgi:NAD(P)-dependent dehydrogenase (short-subunit alcohol dehydrogenase family)
MLIKVLIVTTDVSNPEQVSHLANASYEHYGRVDILCNNAGIGVGGLISLLTKEDWNWVINVNLFGVIYGIQSFLNRMLSTKDPCHIINTSSLAGLTPGDSGPYSASKAAVIAISERLALECFNTNVNVSVICPAFVQSNIIENTEILSETREGLWQPSPVMIQSARPEIENSKKLLELGMDPEVMAEMVIKAIENDIFYIITHPEYLPMIKSRFDSIHSDSLKLHDELLDQQTVKTKTYRSVSPSFSITYPDYFIELNPNPMTKALFHASHADINLEIYVSKISPKRRLEELTKKIVRGLRVISKELEIISEKPTKLRDGTPAYETIFEYKLVGVFKTRSKHLSVIKDQKWIRVSISSAANNLTEKLKEILDSLEFQ